jgi:hypothetical protein
MPTTLHFLMTSNHTIVPALLGGIRYQPAMPNLARLYIINNNGPYVGTTTSVQGRFNPRLDVLWEMGIDQNELNNINIDVLRIEIGGNAAPPDNYGDSFINVWTGGQWVLTVVDVEHLMMRILTQVAGVNVRNTQKWNNLFTNPFPDRLDWSIRDINNGIVANGSIGVGQSL